MESGTDQPAGNAKGEIMGFEFFRELYKAADKHSEGIRAGYPKDLSISQIEVLNALNSAFVSGWTAYDHALRECGETTNDEIAEARRAAENVLRRELESGLKNLECEAEQIDDRRVDQFYRKQALREAYYKVSRMLKGED